MNEASRESRASTIENALNNLSSAVRKLDELISSFDGPIPTSAKSEKLVSAPSATRPEFNLWDSLAVEINVAAEGISKSREYLREKMR